MRAILRRLEVGFTTTELWQVKDGVARRLASGASVEPGQTLALQVEGKRVRVLRDNAIFTQADVELPGAKFGAATRGEFNWDASDVQPTAPVVFRDDFMRAEGPDDAEIPSEWTVKGNWKTSGSLGPKSDAALNPNPFVFRASYAPAAKNAEAAARAGHWFWSDYALTASIRANDHNGSGPLTAALQAFASAGTNRFGRRN